MPLALIILALLSVGLVTVLDQVLRRWLAGVVSAVAVPVRLLRRKWVWCACRGASTCTASACWWRRCTPGTWCTNDVAVAVADAVLVEVAEAEPV